MTAGENEETYVDPFVQEAMAEGQEGAPRRRRTLSGRLVTGRSDFDPWRSIPMMGLVQARREARRKAKAEREEAAALAAGLRPDAGMPEPACIKSGCGVPWSDHLTKGGKLRAAFARSGGHESALEVVLRSRASEFDRRERRALRRSAMERRPKAKVHAALYTHTVFVDPSGKRHRVPNDQVDAFVLRHARNAS